MFKKCFLCLMVILLCVTRGAAQSKGKSSVKKSAVVTYQYDAPYEHWKYGGIYLKINGEVKRFEWGDFTRFGKSILDNPTAREKKGAEWRITYSVDRGGSYSLLSATFTGRIKELKTKPITPRASNPPQTLLSAKGFFCGQTEPGWVNIHLQVGNHIQTFSSSPDSGPKKIGFSKPFFQLPVGTELIIKYKIEEGYGTRGNWIYEAIATGRRNRSVRRCVAD